MRILSWKSFLKDFDQNIAKNEFLNRYLKSNLEFLPVHEGKFTTLQEAWGPLTLELSLTILVMLGKAKM